MKDPIGRIANSKVLSTEIEKVREHQYTKRQRRSALNLVAKRSNSCIDNGNKKGNSLSNSQQSQPHKKLYLMSVVGSFAIFITFYVCNILFYYYMEHWTIIDCVYFVTVSLMTIGYGDLHPTTDPTRLYTVFMILFGFLFILNILHEGALFLIHHSLTPLTLYLYNLPEEEINQSSQFDLMRTDDDFDHIRWVQMYQTRISILYGLVFSTLLLGTLYIGLSENLSPATSLYWAVQTFTSVGYGDIPLSTQNSKLAIVFILFLGVFVFSAGLELVRDVERAIQNITQELKDQGQPISVQQILQLDEDNSGEIDKFECILGILQLRGKLSFERDVQPLLEQFDAIDLNKDGSLSISEILLAAHHQEEKQSILRKKTDRQLRELKALRRPLYLKLFSWLHSHSFRGCQLLLQILPSFNRNQQSNHQNISKSKTTSTMNTTISPTTSTTTPDLTITSLFSSLLGLVSGVFLLSIAFDIIQGLSSFLSSITSNQQVSPHPTTSSISTFSSSHPPIHRIHHPSLTPLSSAQPLEDADSSTPTDPQTQSQTQPQTQSPSTTKHSDVRSPEPCTSQRQWKQDQGGGLERFHFEEASSSSSPTDLTLLEGEGYRHFHVGVQTSKSIPEDQETESSEFCFLSNNIEQSATLQLKKPGGGGGAGRGRRPDSSFVVRMKDFERDLEIGKDFDVERQEEIEEGIG